MRSKVKIYGEVFTPPELVNEMLGKLPLDVWSNTEYKWLDNSCGSGNFLVLVHGKLMSSLVKEIPDPSSRHKHIVENMLYGVDIQQENVSHTYERTGIKHLACCNALEFDYWGIKFDVIVGNPPYNGPKTSNVGSPPTLWPAFVVLSFNLLKENGYLVYVHPPKWRKPEDKLWNIFTNKQFIYLSMHDLKDGKKTFGCITRYDWYVLKNTPGTEPFPVKDIDGIVENITLEEWPFLPSGNFKEIFFRLTKDKSLGYEVTYNTMYGSSNYHIDTKESSEFRHPCIAATLKNGPKIYWSSRNDRGHFGVPKIIIGQLNFHVPIIDKDGKYATTEDAFSFPIKDDSDIKLILNVLEWYKENKKYFLSGYRVEYKLFRCLKRSSFTF